MRLAIDLDTKQFVNPATNGGTAPTLSVQRGDRHTVELVFVRNGQVQELATGADGMLQSNVAGTYTTGGIAHDAEWVKRNTGSETVYEFTLDLYTTECEAAFILGATSVNARLQVRWEAGDEVLHSNALELVVHNSIVMVGGDLPGSLPTAEAWLTGAAVRHDIAQTLDADNKARALSNIGGASVTHTHAEYALASHTHTDYAPTSRAVNASGLATGGGNLTADRTITVPIATNAQAIAGSDNATAMTPLRTAAAIAALASGITIANAKYVNPNGGNDTTGNGSASAPWASLQKAYSMGAYMIFLFPGNAGNVYMSGSWSATLYALGAGVSIGSIDTNGHNLNLTDGYMQSIQVNGPITSTSNSGGPSGGVILRGIGGYPTVDLRGQNNSGPGDWGKDSGYGDFRHCTLGAIDGRGGGGGDGTSETSGGSGGNGSQVFALFCLIGGIDLSGGFPGGDGGMGGGSYGTDGNLKTRFCQISGVGGTLAVDDRHGTIMDNGESAYWID